MSAHGYHVYAHGNVQVRLLTRSVYIPGVNMLYAIVTVLKLPSPGTEPPTLAS